MWKINIFWALLISLFFSGCGKDAAKAGPPEYQKLTLQDLRPVDVPSAQPRIIFDVVTFELSADKVKDIAFEMVQFKPRNMRFYNKELFEKNGLDAYYGRRGDGDKLTLQLRLLGAKHIMRTNLITMDKADEFIPTEIVPSGQYIFSTLSGDRKISQAFVPGKIGWVVTPSLTVRRDTIDVKLVPAHVPAEGYKIRRLAAGKNELGHKPFEQGQLEITMQDGGFLVLAPGRVSTEMTLDKMLFGPAGAKDKMRVYVILFVQIGQE